MASGKKGTLYIGVTSDLIKRVWQHKQSVTEGFTHKYAVKTLVYYEQHESMEAAIFREKQLKNGDDSGSLLLLMEEALLGWVAVNPSLRFRNNSYSSKQWIPACAGMTRGGRMPL